MTDERIVLFDGVCNYCNSTVNFIIRHDHKKHFRFAPLQSDVAKKILSSFGIIKADPDTFFLLENGRLFSRSSAALRLFKSLPRYWKWTQLFWVVPKFLRDAVYTFVARHRYQWFGKRDECIVPGPNIRDRFIH